MGEEEKKRVDEDLVPGNIGLEAYLLQVRERYAQKGAEEEVPPDDNTRARETAEAIHRDIAARPEQQWLPFAPLSAELCRTSPFFPLSKSEVKVRPYLRGFTVTDHSWGKIKFWGEKLSVYEEDVLLAILALIDAGKHRMEVADEEGRTTFAYEGPMRPILQAMGYKNPGGRDQRRLLEAVRLLHIAYFELHRNKGDKIDMDHIFTRGAWDKETRTLSIMVNPYFYEIYIGGGFTLLDVVLRSKLGPIGKALYRFVMSHEKDEWRGALHKLVAALNLNPDQHTVQHRKQIRKAIKELVDIAVLFSSSRIEKGDLVALYRISDTRDRRVIE